MKALNADKTGGAIDGKEMGVEVPTKPEKILGGIVLLIAFGYWLLTLVYVSPNNPIRVQCFYACNFFEALFYQKWEFFAPPPTFNEKVYYIFQPKHSETGKTIVTEVVEKIFKEKQKHAPFNEADDVTDYLISGACDQLVDALRDEVDIREAAARRTAAARHTAAPEQNDDAIAFSLLDICNLNVLADDLKHPDVADAVSRYIVTRLSPTSKRLLADYENGLDWGLQESLVNDLNQIIRGPSIYQAERFADVKFSPTTAKLLEEHPRGQDLMTLNQLLVQDAYPFAVSKEAKGYSPIISATANYPAVKMLERYAWYVCRSAGLEPTEYRAEIVQTATEIPKFKDRKELLNAKRKQQEKPMFLILAFDVPVPSSYK